MERYILTFVRFFLIVITITFCVSNSTNNHLLDPAYQLYYQWKTIDYTFKSNHAREKMIQKKEFIEKNVITTSMKIFKNRMFITTPRFMPGIPSTLNQVPYNCSYDAPLSMKNQSPKLKPFPSWEMQTISNCSAFQTVQSMEIDQFGRMWLTDLGRTEVLDVNPTVRCPAKLVIIDLRDKDKIIFSHEFPEDVVSPKTTFMKDMTVACNSRKKCYAYIADLFDNKLIVFDFERNKSWSVKHPSMVPDPTKTNFSINGYATSAVFGISNSALSPRSRNYDTYYYSAIAGTSVYAVQTSILKSSSQNRNLSDDDVIELGVRKGQSDGWTMDNKGNLYFGDLPENKVFRTRTMSNQHHLLEVQEVAQSDADLSWIDTFAFDNYGMLALTTNRFQLYATPDFNVNEFNFRVLRIRTDTSAYSWRTMMSCNF